MMLLSEFYQWLNSFINYEKLTTPQEFSLTSIQSMTAALDNPQTAYKTIHIAGSKGKGSAAAMMSSLLTARQNKTGLYTSPHINDFRERITANGEFFSTAVYLKAAEIVKGMVQELQPNADFTPTWFELTTLYAYEVFRLAGCNWAVFETGIGGRLDATNIVKPQAVLIMPIELEHTEWLGNTLEKIATEKAGIIKPGIPVFCAEQQPEALAVLRRTATEKNAPFYYIGDYIDQVSVDFTDYENTNRMNATITWKNSPSTHYADFFSQPLVCKLKMPGNVQAKNAALTALCIKVLFPDYNDTLIAQALGKVHLPGRFEMVHTENCDIILDGAHTVSSITNTMEVFSRIYGDRPVVLLFACAADKHIEEIAPLFDHRFSAITVTRPGLKASNIERERKAFITLADPGKLVIEPDWATAITAAMTDAHNKKQPLLVCGSFYLLAEVKKVIATAEEARLNANF